MTRLNLDLRDIRMIYRLAKRLLDVIIALTALLFGAVPMLIIAVLIRLDSKGAAIFTQTRAGKNAKPFRLLKFRTMRTDVDPYGPSPKAGTDPRLTKIGIFLREHSLDELPQLLNVLAGSMSVVGPRPLYIQQIQEWNDRQKHRLNVKPGLTGLAQISGRGALTIEEKLELDVRYVETCSFWFDIRIIFITFMQVFRKQSIYEVRYSKDQDTRGEEK